MAQEKRHQTKPVPPKNLDEARSRRNRLLQEIQQIQGMLGSKNVKNKDGQRMSRAEYQSWRQRAQLAMDMKLNEVRFLKEWMSGADQRANLHLAKLHRLILTLVSEGVDLEDEELEMVEEAGRYLDKAST